MPLHAETECCARRFDALDHAVGRGCRCLQVAPEFPNRLMMTAVDSARARGSLRIETDIGVLDADLAPQLDRLALRLRETLPA